MDKTTPVTPAVREMLERVLSSQTFSRSERARDLLRHLVMREQAGQGEQLKGFSIAVDVFGKDAEFDPTTDAVVRVQAGRLRDLLAQYYAEEGASDVLRISIPRGGYVPVYEWHGQVPGPTPDPPPPIPPKAEETGTLPDRPFNVDRHLTLLWAALAVTAAMVAFVSLRTVTDVSIPPTALSEARAGTTGSVNVPPPDPVALPTVSVATSINAGPEADVAALLRAALTGFETVDLVDQSYAPAIDPARHFNFNLLPVPRVDGVLVQIENPGTGMVLFSRVLSSEDIAAGKVQDSIAELVGRLVPPSGRLFAFLEEKGLQSAPVNCLLRYNEFYQDPVPTRHAAAYRCFNSLAESHGASAIVYALLATLQVEAIVDGYTAPEVVSFDTARALLRRAFQIDPTSAAAHRAYGYLLARAGDATGALRWMEKAYELNTYDPGIAAAYGFALIGSGYYEEGEALMRRAIETTSSHSTWWDYNLFLASFMCGDIDTAFQAAEALVTPGRPYYLAARLMAAHAKGKLELAESLRSRLIREFPAFAANPRSVYAARHTSQDLVDRLVSALEAAGLGGAG